MKKQPERLPEEVNTALLRWAKQHPMKVTAPNGEVIEIPRAPTVIWDQLNECYFFWAHGMYHGVELDGHIHT